ncbi:hypothetical protein PSHI_47950 [Pseudomonas sp. URMO17WK12:I11]|nr:hypothetical protein PSHI_47950 [Pseudomonas sp. URMO17WK12:I11]
MLRHAKLFRVLRGHAKYSTHRKQMSLNQGLSQSEKHLEGNVEPLFNEIHYSIVNHNINFDVWIDIVELCH